MPIIKSAIKRSRQAIKRRDRNVGIKRDIKSAVKAFLAEPSATTLAAAHSELDTAVKKNLLKKNTVARRKSALARTAKASGVSLTTATKPSTTAKTAVKTGGPSKKPAVTKSPAKTPVKPRAAAAAKKSTDK